MIRTALLLLLLATAMVGFSQNNSKAALQQQRTALSKQLEMLNRQIARTDKHIHVSAQQRAVLQQKLAVYKQQIVQLDKQLGAVQDHLQKTDARLAEMYTKLVGLKRNYAASLVLSWKLMNEPQVIKVVYAADDANETQQRIQYIKVLRRLQLQQVKEIRSLQQEFDVRRKQLGITEEQMAAQLQLQVNISAQLSGKEKTLQAETQQLEQKKNDLLALVKRKTELQRSIENRLRALTAAAPKPAPKPAPRPAGGKTATPVIVNKEPVANRPAPLANKSIISNKGFLPCPVNGSISMHFGLVKIKGGDFDNQFLTFQTNSAGAAVANVFAGMVTEIQKDEDQYIVYVLHGDVYTIYGNLQSVSVQKGQEISSGAIVGRTSLNMETGKGEMEFGIYRNKKLVDPEPWLGCR